MAGNTGSPLCAELNRIANYGVYPDRDDFLEEQGAANVWAGTSGLGILGALNYIVDPTRTDDRFSDLTKVCNELASTTGLSDVDALRTINHPAEVLLRGTTPQSAVWAIDATDASASGQTITNLGTAGALLPTTVGSSLAADSNDPKFLDHTGTNYVYLPGVASNSIFTPSTAALQITGDIDVRVQAAMDDWTPATDMTLASKRTTGNISWELRLQTTGILLFEWYADGVTVAGSKAATVATGIADGAVKWIRATLDVNNGASGNDVKFFTSDNGTTWTQLGTTVTTAGVTSIFGGTANIEIGTRTTMLGAAAAGKFYRAQIYSDITETTKVLDVDTSVITTGAATSFTAVTGQTVTINRSTSGRKTVAVTQPTWLFGTDDYMEVNNRYMAHSTAAENYVYLSGASGNYMSVADNPPLDVTGDIDIRVQVALDDWTPSTDNLLVGKWSSSNQSYYLAVGATTGILSFRWSANGTTANTASSTVAPTVTDGSALWVRVTFDVDNGAGGNTAKFFTSTNGTTWTQLGADVVTAGTTSIFSGTGIVEIGTRLAGTSLPAKGKFFRAQILNGIDGTIVLDADASVITLPSQTTFVDRSSNAYTVTINKSGVGTFVSTGNYLYIPYNFAGTNHLSSPDSAALDIVGDLDLRIKVQADNWNNTAGIVLLNKGGAAGQKSYLLQYAGGQLGFIWSANGTAETTKVSTVTTLSTTPPGTVLWLRVTFDVDNGASGNTVTFYTSTDGINWTVYGAPVVTAGVTSIFSSTGLLRTGDSNGGNVFSGGYYRIQVLNGINGTLVFDANLESSITTALPTTFTESSSNAATVTVNYQGSAYRPYGVTTAGYLYPGATNTFANSTTDFLNMGATDSFTALTVVRQWNTPVSFARYLSKAITGNTAAWQVMPEGTAYTVWAVVRDTGAEVNAGRVSYSQGSLTPISMVVNRATQTLTAYAGNNSGSASSISTKGSLSNPGSLWIGTSQAGSAQDFEFIGAAVFRTVLTPKNLADIQNYFNGRD